MSVLTTSFHSSWRPGGRPWSRFPLFRWGRSLLISSWGARSALTSACLFAFASALAVATTSSASASRSASAVASGSRSASGATPAPRSSHARTGQLQPLSVKVFAVQFLHSVFHITWVGELNNTLSLTFLMALSKCHFTCFSEEIFQVLPWDTGADIVHNDPVFRVVRSSKPAATPSPATVISVIAATTAVIATVIITIIGLKIIHISRFLEPCPNQIISAHYDGQINSEDRWTKPFGWISHHLQPIHLGKQNHHISPLRVWAILSRDI